MYVCKTVEKTNRSISTKFLTNISTRPSVDARKVLDENQPYFKKVITHKKVVMFLLKTVQTVLNKFRLEIALRLSYNMDSIVYL